jgi:hypothetical protein
MPVSGRKESPAGCISGHLHDCVATIRVLLYYYNKNWYYYNRLTFLFIQAGLAPAHQSRLAFAVAEPPAGQAGKVNEGKGTGSCYHFLLYIRTLLNYVIITTA